MHSWLFNAPQAAQQRDNAMRFPSPKSQPHHVRLAAGSIKDGSKIHVKDKAMRVEQGHCRIFFCVLSLQR